MSSSAHVIARQAGNPYQVSIEAGPYRLASDEPAALGGGGTAPTPFQLLLAGLGACTAITLRMYAQRKGWTLPSLDVDVRLHEQEGAKHVERVLAVGGELSEEQRARLVEISEKTPVTLVLKQGVEIRTRLG